jgi:hypothetical protein
METLDSSRTAFPFKVGEEAKLRLEKLFFGNQQAFINCRNGLIEDQFQF